ncbi:hypothetical protein HBI47_070210 [Parastagonospora nodorum]|nr:hypothetical protein HBI47_070210 [Parastagonospora nodorum]
MSPTRSNIPRATAPRPHMRSMPLDLLSLPPGLRCLTCRLIILEAAPHISRKLEQLKKTDRFHFVIEPTSLYPVTYDDENIGEYVFKARNTGASIYKLPRNAFPDYRFDIDVAGDFVRKVAVATSNLYPATTTLAIRFSQDASRASFPVECKVPVFVILKPEPMKARLGKLVPRLVKEQHVFTGICRGRADIGD